MADNHEQTETGKEKELADLRHEKFGHLPTRVLPDDLVETEEAKGPHEDPDEHLVRREWG
jgi:hypothetical protein